MNANEFIGLLENNPQITTITVKFLRIWQSINFTAYSNVGNIFYIYQKKYEDGVAFDLEHYKGHEIIGHTLEISIGMLYQEKFIQLFQSDIGHFGHFSLRGKIQ